MLTKHILYAIHQVQCSFKFLFCEVGTDSLHSRGATPISNLIKIGSVVAMISLKQKLADPQNFR